MRYTNNLSCNRCEFHHAKQTARRVKEIWTDVALFTFGHLILFSFLRNFFFFFYDICNVYAYNFSSFFSSPRYLWHDVRLITIQLIERKKKSIAFIGVMKQDCGKELVIVLAVKARTERKWNVEHVFHLFTYIDFCEHSYVVNAVYWRGRHNRLRKTKSHFLIKKMR